MGTPRFAIRMCDHWKELDDERGEYEWCRAIEQEVMCAASQSKCMCPAKFKEIQHEEK